jgi:beta-glucosidase
MRAPILLAALLVPAALPAQTPPYRDIRLPLEQRAADLVGRMTLAEKVAQMIDAAPAIPRLGVPAYGWWNEALHGVARAGLATSFPQAIGLAATWDDSLIFAMATVIGIEARAKHHDFARRGERSRYQGLTFWSPNINLFRDPRWGRGQETYGEDPFLTARLAVPFIRGLQGDHPRWLRTIATVKHYAVHSGPEPERHSFDAVVSERDLRESYLPHFAASIREGGAYSLMCAYNRVYGAPACGSNLLLDSILRGAWRFPGYVVSDCGAIDDMYLRHRVVGTAAAAAALGVRSGTDLDCGRVYPNLVAAVRQGLISEAQIDTSVTRLFLARFRLGLFDPPDSVPYAQTPLSALDQPAHRALALRAARQSIVLLRNQGDLLPLPRDLGTIAVIGPNADDWRTLLGNYLGIPADPVTPLRGIREAVAPRTRVLYARGADLADGFPALDQVPSTALVTARGRPGLDVAYFAGRASTGEPVTRAVDSAIAIHWHHGAPAGLAGDSFAVRWTATLRPPVTGTYRLGLMGTMRFRLYLGDSLVLRSEYQWRDDEFPDPRLRQTAPLTLAAGRSYRLRVEAEESYGDADLQLVWARPIDGLEAEAVRAARQADVVVLFLGLTPRLEGEEMEVEIAGFRGGDRTSLDLPDAQQRLLERIVALGKPTVLVLLSGSAVAITWAEQHVPAIILAWYPGQAGGTAIADVLFGDYNPAGRLPVTFYRSAADLPPFADYAMAGRTYRFFTGAPLYPFGYGLSFTSFRYANLRTSADTAGAAGAADTITVSFDLTNVGTRAGEEVAQLYVRYPRSAMPRPQRDLRGFRRVRLEPGETRTVTLRLPIDYFSYWDVDADRWTVEPGPVQLQVGSSSADIRLERTIVVAR